MTASPPRLNPGKTPYHRVLFWVYVSVYAAAIVTVVLTR